MNTATSFTNFSDAPTDWAFAGRLDWKLTGDWVELEDFNAQAGQEPVVMLGVAGMGQKFNGNAAFDDPFNIDLESNLPTALLGFPGPESIDGSHFA